MPKKTKYRKSHRGRRKGNSKGGNTVILVTMEFKQLKLPMSQEDR